MLLGSLPTLHFWDADADTFEIGSDFATGVAAATVTGDKVVIPASSGRRDLIIDKVIDEGAETFEIIPVSGQFSSTARFSTMTLSDGTTTLTFDSFLNQDKMAVFKLIVENLYLI